MRPRAIVVSLLLGVGACALVAAAGCKDDAATPSRVLSRKGEACNVTNDCAEGLACVPVPGGSIGVCTVGQFKIAETAKECALLECKTATDCCPPLSANCLFLQSSCQAGNQNSCTTFNSTCRCDTNIHACEQNKCVTNCTLDTECLTSLSGRKCVGGRCAQCALDVECATGQTCLNGTCRSPCETDGDCAGFARCIAGRCIESGCQTDRECVAATRNVEATCGTNGKCKVPCQTDLECGSPRDYAFFSCLRNECVYTGCQTDKDCRLLFTGPSDASTLGPNERVVCRDRTSPNDTTKPAN